MILTSSYGVRLLGVNKVLYPTVHIYQKAVRFLCVICNNEWGSISKIKNAKEAQLYTEHLVHKTASNTPLYDAPSWFENLPCYMRRAAISEAIGKVSSFKKSYDNWIASGKHGGEPRLGTHTSNGPVFYRDNMYNQTGRTTAEIKIYDGHSYVWHEVNLRKQDIRYIEKHCVNGKMSAPKLVMKHGTAWLVFSFEENISLSEDKTRVVGCDLGINSDAALCLMESDGTILLRKFVNFKSDKAVIWHLMNITRRVTKKSGPRAARKTWEYIQLLNSLLADRIAKEIVDFAASYGASYIVFEHLDMSGHKTKSQKISMWRKNDIQKKAEHKAHKLGIHISRVCAWNTSALAFDGSGKLVRDKSNHALSTFSNGKQYNCDLSASYNIAARFYIREILQTLSSKERSYIGAKVPGCMARTTCTMADLISLNAALKSYAPGC